MYILQPNVIKMQYAILKAYSGLCFLIGLQASDAANSPTMCLRVLNKAIPHSPCSLYIGGLAIIAIKLLP